MASPFTLILAILTVESSNLNNVERPARGVPDTVQFWLGSESQWRIKTFAIDHDIHVHRIAIENEARRITAEFARNNIKKSYGDVTSDLLTIQFSDPTDEVAVERILKENSLNGTLEHVEAGYYFYNPDEGVYKTKSKPIIPDRQNKAEEPTPNPPPEQIGSFHRRGSPKTFAKEMKMLIRTLVLLSTFGVASAGEDEGLFIPSRGAEQTQSIENGEIVAKLKADRQILTSAVFRYDTDDKARFWLELDFTKMIDPGDFYVFVIDGQNYQGFVVRGEGSNAGGARWALGFSDASTGRTLLNKIAKACDLPAERVEDKTQANKTEMATTNQPSD